jgi:hypothetical protein
MASLRLFLAIAAAMDLELCQLDIDTALLYAPISEDINIRHPLGFSNGTTKVCHLKRRLYGLKQPPANSTCYSENGSSTLVGSDVSPTRASTSYAPDPSSP